MAPSDTIAHTVLRLVMLMLLSMLLFIGCAGRSLTGYGSSKEFIAGIRTVAGHEIQGASISVVSSGEVSTFPVDSEEAVEAFAILSEKSNPVVDQNSKGAIMMERSLAYARISFATYSSGEVVVYCTPLGLSFYPSPRNGMMFDNEVLVNWVVSVLESRANGIDDTAKKISQAIGNDGVLERVRRINGMR